MSNKEYDAEAGLLLHCLSMMVPVKRLGTKSPAQPILITYVFNEAAFTTSRDPQWRSGVKGGALLFDGYSKLGEPAGGRYLASKLCLDDYRLGRPPFIRIGRRTKAFSGDLK